MKTTPHIAIQKAEKMEHLKYESFLNAIEQAFIGHKTGIRHTDAAMLKFANEIIGKFAAIYANTRSEALGEQLQEIILLNPPNNN